MTKCRCNLGSSSIHDPQSLARVAKIARSSMTHHSFSLAKLNIPLLSISCLKYCAHVGYRGKKKKEDEGSFKWRSIQEYLMESTLLLSVAPEREVEVIYEKVHHLSIFRPECVALR